MNVPAYSVAGNGDGLLLCLHGIGGNRQSFDDLLADPPPGWRVAAWDMPGYGDSAPFDELSWRHLAGAAVAVIDALRAPRAVLLGHSMGGMVAQEVAARHPERVAGLILFATSAAFGGRDDSFRNAFLAERLAPLEKGLRPAEFADKVVGAMFTADTPRAVREKAVASMAAVPADAYRQALEVIVTFDRREALERISCPTLVLAAERDSLAPPKTMEKMAARIPGAEYRCLPGVGHLANFEDPALFNGAVFRFLTDICQATRGKEAHR